MTANDNVVIVTGTATIIKQPDTSTLKITVFSKKSTPQEASESVKRRVDYVLQVLRLHGFDKQKIEHKTRLEEDKTAMVPVFTENGSSKPNTRTEFNCTSDICAEMEPTGQSSSDVLQRVWETHNVLVDKIGGKNTEQTAVTIRAPVQIHTDKAIQQTANLVGKQAIENGKLKALQWCDTLGARLGDCTKVIELENGNQLLGKEASLDPIQLDCKVQLTFNITRD